MTDTKQHLPVAMAKPLIGDDERAAVGRVLASGQIAQGPEVAAFEAEFAEFSQASHAIAVNSGTSALHVALLASGIGPGDEVLVPSFTFAATANSVRLTGATPVFVDINPLTYCMSVDDAADKVTESTAAIMPVHLYGHPADAVSLQDLAQRKGLLMVEDAAQAHGADSPGGRVGSIGDLAAFSFYPTKNMTTGEGGMITTNDSALARRCRLFRNQGMEVAYENEVVGLNNRMTDISAAIGRVQLQRLPGFNAARQQNAERLTALIDGATTPTVAEGCTHVFHQYTVRVPQRGVVLEALKLAEIGFGIYYPTPVHRLPAFAMSVALPATEDAAAEVLSLPVGPHLKAGDVERVAQVLNAVVDKVMTEGAK